MALVALAPIRNAHCVRSAEIPKLANTGIKISDIKVHLAVAETINKFTIAVKRIKRISVRIAFDCIAESISAPIMAMHLSK